MAIRIMIFYILIDQRFLVKKLVSDNYKKFNLSISYKFNDYLFIFDAEALAIARFLRSIKELNIIDVLTAAASLSVFSVVEIAR